MSEKPPTKETPSGSRKNDKAGVSSSPDVTNVERFPVALPILGERERLAAQVRSGPPKNHH